MLQDGNNINEKEMSDDEEYGPWTTAMRNRGY